MDAIFTALLIFTGIVAIAVIVKIMRIAQRGHRSVEEWLKS